MSVSRSAVHVANISKNSLLRSSLNAPMDSRIFGRRGYALLTSNQNDYLYRYSTPRQLAPVFVRASPTQ